MKREASTLLAGWFQRLGRSRFLRNVAVVTSGTAAAQAITIAFSPIITRLYGPDAFGNLGVFVAVVAVLSPVVTLAYGRAIVLPASDRDAEALLRLSLLVGIGVSISSAVIFGGLHRQIARVLGFNVAAQYLLLVPIVLLFSAPEEALSQWLIRKGQFRSVARVAVAQSAAVGAAKAGVGLFVATAPALFVLNAVGHALRAVLLWVGARSTLVGQRIRSTDIANRAKLSPLGTVAHTYRDFPMYRAPQALLNALSQHIPTLMLTAFFGPVPAGFYVLSTHVLTLPSALISESFGMVFRAHIAEAGHRGQRLRPLVLKVTVGLAAIGLLPFGVVIAFGPWLFGAVFGADWITAGEYARWLALWVYFMFVAVPCVEAIPLLGLQGQFLLFSVLLVAVRAGTLVFGALVLTSDVGAIAAFSVAGALLNIGLTTWVLLSSGGRLREDLRGESKE